MTKVKLVFVLNPDANGNGIRRIEFIYIPSEQPRYGSNEWSQLIHKAADSLAQGWRLESSEWAGPSRDTEPGKF